MATVSRLSLALVLITVFSSGVLLFHLHGIETKQNLRSEVSRSIEVNITRSVVTRTDATSGDLFRRSYRISMVAYPKTGSTWLALLLGNFMSRYHANTIQFGAKSNYPCDLDEYTEHKTNNRSHCCVFFVRVPGCVHGRSRSLVFLSQRKNRSHAPSANAEVATLAAPLEPMPLFSGDKHMQYLRKCGFSMPMFAPLRRPELPPDQRIGYKCALNFSQGIQTLSRYDRLTQRFFLLVRDPRDISGSFIPHIPQYYHYCSS